MKLDFKNNNLVGIAGVAVIVICLGIVFYPFIQTSLKNKKLAKESAKFQKQLGVIEQKDTLVIPEPAGKTAVVSEEKAKAALGNQENLDDPFLNQNEEAAFKDAGNSIVITNLDLSAIFYSPSASKAIINGRVVTAGDIVDNKEITDIKENEVFLEDTRGKYVVQLKPVR